MSDSDAQPTPGGYEVVPPAPPEPLPAPTPDAAQPAIPGMPGYQPPTYKQYQPPTYEHPQYTQYQPPAYEAPTYAPPPAPDSAAPDAPVSDASLSDAGSAEIAAVQHPDPSSPAPAQPLPPYGSPAYTDPAFTTGQGYPISTGHPYPRPQRSGSSRVGVIMGLVVALGFLVVFGIVASVASNVGSSVPDGFSDPGFSEPDFSDPGFGDPGFGDPDFSDPGLGDGEDPFVDDGFEEEPVDGTSADQVGELLQTKLDEYRDARSDGSLWERLPDTEFNRTAVSAFLFLLTDMKSATLFGVDDATAQEYVTRADELERLLLAEQPLGDDITIDFGDRTFTYDGATGEGGYTEN